MLQCPFYPCTRDQHFEVAWFTQKLQDFRTLTPEQDHTSISRNKAPCSLWFSILAADFNRSPSRVFQYNTFSAWLAMIRSKSLSNCFMLISENAHCVSKMWQLLWNSPNALQLYDVTKKSQVCKLGYRNMIFAKPSNILQFFESVTTFDILNTRFQQNIMFSRATPLRH